MKVFKILLCLFFLFNYCYGSTQPVNKMEDVFKKIEEAHPETLIIFDVDMVLVQPSDPAFQMANMKRHSAIAKRIVNNLPEEKRDLFLILMTLSSEPILLDEKLPHYLQKIKEKKVPTCALTANFTGKFAHVDNLEIWKTEKLKKLGIDFSDFVFCQENLVFYELPTYRDHYSLFQSGILFANGPNCSKGAVLIHFLHKIGYHPKKVLFIDDREENLKNVEEALKTNFPSIEFEGIQFIGAKEFPSTTVSETEFEEKWQKLADLARRVD